MAGSTCIPHTGSFIVVLPLPSQTQPPPFHYGPAYEAATGRQLWTRELSSATGVSLDARFAYVSDDKGAVHTLDRSNGQSVWKQDKLSYRQLTQPLPEGQTIVIGDFEGFIHFLARDSGAFVSRFDTKGGAVRAVPIALPAGLLVQTEDGSLHALVP